MPAKGTTKVGTEYRINRIARLLANGATRSDCVQYGAQEWGLQPRQIDNYIRRAREKIREDFSIDRQQFIAELLAQLSTLQMDARKTGNQNVALGCINSAARIARVFE